MNEYIIVYPTDSDGNEIKNITEEDIALLCSEVRHFSRKAHLRLDACPVITWIFAESREWMVARALVLRAMSPAMQTAGNVRHGNDGRTIEIDCEGVLFRLVLRKSN